MKKFLLTLTVVAGAGLLLSDFAFSQREDNDRPGAGQQGGRPPRGEGGRPPRGEGGPPPRGEGGRPPRGEGGGPPGGPGGPGGGFRPPAHPITQALDADKDGIISSKEIANAVAALKTLDKNKDGRLTDDEIRPPRPGGFGPPGGGPGGQGGRGGDGPPGGGRPGEGNAGRGGQGGQGGGGVEGFLARFDKNKDGKLQKSEMPGRLGELAPQVDANKDGELDKAELEKLMERFRSRRGEGGGGRPGGEGGRPPRDGEGGRPPRDGEKGGDRPRRPPVDE